MGGQVADAFGIAGRAAAGQPRRQQQRCGDYSDKVNAQVDKQGLLQKPCRHARLVFGKGVHPRLLMLSELLFSEE